jgi:hypothetical protein
VCSGACQKQANSGVAAAAHVAEPRSIAATRGDHGARGLPAALHDARRRQRRAAAEHGGGAPGASAGARRQPARRAAAGDHTGDVRGGALPGRSAQRLARQGLRGGQGAAARAGQNLAPRLGSGAGATPGGTHAASAALRPAAVHVRQADAQEGDAAAKDGRQPGRPQGSADERHQELWRQEQPQKGEFFP